MSGEPYLHSPVPLQLPHRQLSQVADNLRRVRVHSPRLRVVNAPAHQCVLITTCRVSHLLYALPHVRVVHTGDAVVWSPAVELVTIAEAVSFPTQVLFALFWIKDAS